MGAAVGTSGGGGDWPASFPRGARSLDDLRDAADGDRPNGRWDSDYGRFFLGWYSQELVAHGDRVMGAAADVFNGTGARLALKCAGIHWWYRTRSHAAELTTGYYNVLGGSDLDQLGESFVGLGSSHSLSRVDSGAGGRPLHVFATAAQEVVDGCDECPRMAMAVALWVVLFCNSTSRNFRQSGLSASRHSIYKIAIIPHTRSTCLLIVV